MGSSFTRTTMDCLAPRRLPEPLESRVADLFLFDPAFFRPLVLCSAGAFWAGWDSSAGAGVVGGTVTMSPGKVCAPCAWAAAIGTIVPRRKVATPRQVQYPWFVPRLIPHPISY